MPPSAMGCASSAELSGTAARPSSSARAPTEVCKACGDGRYELVDILLQAGGDLDIRDARGHTPIAHATERVKSLIWWRCARVGDLPRLKKLLASAESVVDLQGELESRDTAEM